MAQSATQQLWDGKVQMGDDPRWADPAFLDDDWPAQPLYPAPDTQAVYWVRVPVTLDTAATQYRPLGVRISILASSEAYWDGVRIGRSGRVGESPTAEVPGRIRSTWPVPDSLATPGRHLLALRLSNFHMPASITYYLYGLEVGSYGAITEWDPNLHLWPLFYLGVFFVLTAYIGGLYLLDTDRPTLGAFSLLCLSTALLLGVESWRWFFAYAYDWHLVRLRGIVGLTAVLGTLLPLFFCVQFRERYTGGVMAGTGVLVALSLLAPTYDAKSFCLYGSAFLVSSGVVGRALLREKRGAVPASVGVGGCALALGVEGMNFIYDYFYHGLGLIVLCFLASLALQQREQRREHEAALLNAARLRLELLKKHLQPHFLLNSLTAATEWIETEPETGARFVNALSGELRALSDVSDRSLISLGTELDLCRRHLEIMGYRQGLRYELETDGVDEDARVPPATFHTLLENALTHNDYTSLGDATIRFRLREEPTGDGRRYALETPCPEPSSLESPDPEPSAPDAPSPPESRWPKDERSGGLGLRYVEARLTECYADEWTLTSKCKNGIWTTVVDLPSDE